MTVEDNDIILITEEEAGTRLDTILAQRFKEAYSRTYFQTLITEHRVLLNGAPALKRCLPKAGDEVEIDFLLTPELDLKPEPIPLEIIFEDDDILAINKPAGMVVHPAVGNWSGTFVNALLHHCRMSAFDPASVRPGIVHRLDKDTSGLLLAAKNPLAQQRLIALFSGRQIHKEYLAVCLGNPGNVEIDAPIGRHPVHRKLMAVMPDGGRNALSLCRTLATDGKISVVSIVLVTGRTHQIRVHLKHQKTPVLGDATYGNPTANKRYGADKQLLHARKLEFIHPMTGKPMLLSAPIPPMIQTFMDKFIFVD